MRAVLLRLSALLQRKHLSFLTKRWHLTLAVSCFPGCLTFIGIFWKVRRIHLWILPLTPEIVFRE